MCSSDLDYVPHDARQREFLTGDKDGLARQRLEVMLDHGLQPVLVPDHKIEDGVNATRVTLPRVWFDAAKCAKGIDALREYKREWDEKKRTF